MKYKNYNQYIELIGYISEYDENFYNEYKKYITPETIKILNTYEDKKIKSIVRKLIN